MIYLIYSLYLIAIILWSYMFNIFYKLYILRTNLKLNNCVIINDKNNSNNSNNIINIINKCNQYFIDIFYKDLIFNINDSINLIKNLKSEQNIILETCGGNIDSNDHILNHIISYNLKLNIFVFKNAQSAGTLIALAANKLYMTWTSFLGPTDPQITIDDILYSVKALCDLCENKDKNYVSDKYLLTYYDTKKLHTENIETLNKILNNKFKKNISYDNKTEFIKKISEGDISHHVPFNYKYLNKYININSHIPNKIINIYNLYEKYL